MVMRTSISYLGSISNKEDMMILTDSKSIPKLQSEGGVGKLLVGVEGGVELEVTEKVELNYPTDMSLYGSRGCLWSWKYLQ